MNFETLSEIMGCFRQGVFASMDENGCPDMRAWEFQFVRDGKLVFTTSSEKSVYRQLRQNPRAAFYCDVDDWHIRVSGQVVFETDVVKLAEVHSAMDEGVRALYPKIDSNGFSVFYFEHGTVKIAQGFAPFDSLVF